MNHSLCFWGSSPIVSMLIPASLLHWAGEKSKPNQKERNKYPLNLNNPTVQFSVCDSKSRTSVFTLISWLEC